MGENHILPLFLFFRITLIFLTAPRLTLKKKKNLSVVKLLKNGKSILDYLLLCLWHKQTQKVNTTITALDSNLQSREIFESKYLGHRKTCRRRTCWKSQIKTTEQYTGNLQSSPHFQRTSDFCEQIKQKDKEFASTKIITIRSGDGCYHFIITAIFFLSFCLFFSF